MINIKENGIYYTPSELAKYFVRPLIHSKYKSIFDPAYGDGSLLLASEAVSEELRIDHGLEYFGCDIHPVNGLLTHLPQANLLQKNFFDYDSDSKYDLVITNPPYVKHQMLDKELLSKYRHSIPEFSFLNNLSDLWAFFLVKSITHLKRNGSIGAILPWSFIQADYSRGLRKWLAENFRKIKLHALNKPYFDKAEERVVLLWLMDYGDSNEEISIKFSDKITDRAEFQNLRIEDWISDKIIPVPQSYINDIYSVLQDKYDFQQFSDFTKIKIGIVTGANKYFIRDKKYLDENGFSNENQIPIITSGKELPDLLVNGSANLKRLILLNEHEKKKFDWFIQEGLKSEYHKRSHSKLRKHWYKIENDDLPDAFFPYRMSKIPYMFFNNKKVQSTNSIHRLYFDNIKQIEMKWVFVSLLSVYGQLSLSVNSKTYGKGMMKIEPSGLYNSFVLKSSSKRVERVYNKIHHLLAINNKVTAVDLATDFINDYLDIPADMHVSAYTAWRKINESRVRY